MTFYWLARSFAPRKRFLIIGTSPTALNFARELHGRDDLGVDIVGFVDPDKSANGTAKVSVIGSLEDIPAIVRARSVDRVVVSLADARGKLPMSTLLQMKLDGVTFDHLTSVYEEYTGKIAVENLRPSWLIFAEGFRKSRGHAVVKRVTDICFAATALIVLSPLLLLVALTVRLTSRGPVLYHQRRVGQNGRLFFVHKFRSMVVDAEAATGAVWAAKKGDSRITPLGGFMRRSRLAAAAAVEHPVRAHEPGRTAARAAEFVSRCGSNSVLRQPPHRQAGPDGWAQVRHHGAMSKTR